MQSHPSVFSVEPLWVEKVEPLPPACYGYFADCPRFPLLCAEAEHTDQSLRQAAPGHALEKLAQDASGIQLELQNPRLRPLTRERLTLLCRAFSDQARRLAEPPATLEELSIEFNVSRERVRQLEVRAFEKVHDAVQAAALAAEALSKSKRPSALPKPVKALQ